MDHFCGPPLEALQQVHVSAALKTPHLDAVLQVRPHSTEQRGRITASPCWPPCFGCSTGYRWLSGLRGHIAGSHPASHPPVPSGPFQQGYAQSSHPQLYCIVLLMDVASTQVQDPILEFIEPHEVLLLAHRWSLSRSLWMASRLSAVSTTAHSLVPSTVLLRVHSTPLSLPLIRILKNFLDNSAEKQVRLLFSFRTRGAVQQGLALLLHRTSFHAKDTSALCLVLHTHSIGD